MPDLPALPPVASKPLTVALLAHNDAAHVEHLISAWSEYLNTLERDYQLLVVDDGSVDDTSQRAEGLREKVPRLETLRHKSPTGVGAALRTALSAARHPLFFYTLCDPRYRPDDLARLLKSIDLVHCVAGYRAGRSVPVVWRTVGWISRLLCRVILSAAPEPLPGWLGWRGHGASLLARVFFGVRNRDVLCPYRLTRREIFARIPLQSNGPFVHIEILAKANFLGRILSEDIALGDHDRPVKAEARDGPGEGFFKDFRRVLDRPDFGPTVLLPPEKAVTTCSVEKLTVGGGTL